jgi:methylglutaconyl-CoA hydratase
MGYETLQIDTTPTGIATLTLNRPDKRNALSTQMITELTDFAHKISAMRGARAIVLRGAGTVFCAGGDLGWMQAQIAADRAERMTEARKLAMMFKALNDMPVPLIGQVHGAAMGGGVGLLCVCDVVIAEASATFGLTETRLGLIPATIGPYVVARMGEGATRRVFMSSRRFDAQEARSLGLVADVVPQDTLEARVAQETAPYLRVAPGAVGAAKRMARQLGPKITEAMINSSIEALADIWEGDEAAEGIAAFLEKRPPVWD